jgi:N-acetylglutamate synthase-like GNAT family acetyltransferase
MIRECHQPDTDGMYQIIDEAAKAYAGFLPDDCYHRPYMSMAELLVEMESMTFFGWEDAGQLIGVMASEPVEDVTLVRHAYVLMQWQGKGIGGRLDYRTLVISAYSTPL